MTEETNLPVPPSGNLPAWAAAKLQQPKFHDDFTARDLLLPWMIKLGGTSRYLKANKPDFIAGAEEGDITDTLTFRLRKTQTIILVKYEVHYTTFKGLRVVRQWFTDRSAYDAARFPAGKDFGKKQDIDGNDVVETPMYYILMVDTKTGAAQPACMAWGSTQAKKTRRVNALAREDIFMPQQVADGRVVMVPQTPPIYSRLFDITTVPEANDDNSWVGWKADVGDLVWLNQDFGEAWFAKAEAFREQIEKGNVRPMAEVEHDEDDTGGRVERRAASTVTTEQRQELDAEIPF